MIPKDGSVMYWYKHISAHSISLSLHYECREEEVHVLGFEASEEELMNGLKTTHNQR